MGAKKRLKKQAERLAACVLACALLCSGIGMSALAANGTKNAVSRAIAIVFDNSGSMYMQNNQAWSRATYAIEVFASMMNEGDTLQVYPMYDITIAGQTYTSQNPFTIHGGDDTSIIQTLYTPFAGNTPIETITDAYNGLRAVSADEQWLIVLTDGAVFYENDIELSSSATRQRLEEVLTEYNQGVNVLYLGIDAAAAMPSVAPNGTNQYYSDKASDSSDTLTKLTEMCNMIFGRDVLDSNSTQMSFDVSMKKLILFVQGSDISNVTLTDSTGASVGSPTRQYSPRYGELGAGTARLDGAPLSFSTDTSLSGYIAVYDTELDAGTYTLSYSGNATNVSAYYEPDIDLTASLTDETGTVMTADSELYPGTYQINYGLVDKNGNMTTSDLLGQTSFTVTYSVSGVEQTVQSDRNGQVAIDLHEGDVLDGKITVTYLSGYTITKNASDFGWPSGGFQVVGRTGALLELQVSGGQTSYPLFELENFPYTLQILLEGTPMTAELLASTQIDVTLSGGNAGYAMEAIDGGYRLNLQYADVMTETICGEYTMDIVARYPDEYGVVSESNTVSLTFELLDQGNSLSMDIDGANYYVISNLDFSEPILVTLSADGAPLTDEQLAQTAFSINGDGLTCEYEPVYGESAFAVRIVADEAAKSGNYTLSFTATAKDQIGRDISANETKQVELSTYPLWVRIVIILLIIALVIALILWYLSRKILPKRIAVNSSQTAFIVDGDTVNGAAKCNYSGGGKRSGSLQVSMPNYSGNSLVKGGFTLHLAAVSPRRTKSCNRRAQVTGISVSNSAAMQNLSVGTHSLVKVEEESGYTWLFDSKQVSSANPATNFELGGKPTCTFVGETITGESFTLTVQLLFK